MLSKADGSVWIAFRPKKAEFESDTVKTTDRVWSPSAIQLVQVQFDDDNGHLLSHMCWFAPISAVDGSVWTFGGPDELQDMVEQYLLLLPEWGKDEGDYLNMYYAIGSKWTERTYKNGVAAFGRIELPEKLFEDWVP